MDGIRIIIFDEDDISRRLYSYYCNKNDVLIYAQSYENLLVILKCYELDLVIFNVTYNKNYCFEEMIKSIKDVSLNKEVKIVCVTTFLTPDFTEHSRNLGVNIVIEKSMNFKDLFYKINSLFNKNLRTNS